MIGAATVTTAVPVLPSLVAVIVAEPVATAVSRPLVFTFATAGALLVHVTERPVNTFPLASLSVAVSCCVAPGFWLTVAGLSDTDATGAITVTFATPLSPSLVAVIVAEPVVTAVSRPLLLTVATVGVLLVQVTERPVTTFPVASLSVAVNCCVPPIIWLTLPGVTVTDATGAGTVLATRSVAIVRLSTHIV